MIMFPHCDSEIVHSNGNCTDCDNCPDLQDDRAKSGYNFTGESKLGKLPCPSDARRAKAGQTRPSTWYGNVPNSPVITIGQDPMGHAFTQLLSSDLYCLLCQQSFTKSMNWNNLQQCEGAPNTVYRSVAIKLDESIEFIEFKVNIDNKDYNDTCPKCQAQAYRGFSTFECSKGCK